MTKWGRRAEGQATIELALVLPLILGLLLGLVQIGLVIRDRVLVVHAAREAARAASVSPTLAAARQAAVGSTRLEPDRVDVELRRLSGEVDELVEATVRYRSPTTVPIVGVLVGDVTLVEKVTMRLETG